MHASSDLILSWQNLCRLLEHLSKSINHFDKVVTFLCYFWRLLHNQLHYFIIVDLSHGVGYMRTPLYCFPWIFFILLGKERDLNNLSLSLVKVMKF
jgi:hypothetical protein